MLRLDSPPVNSAGEWSFVKDHFTDQQINRRGYVEEILHGSQILTLATEHESTPWWHPL